MEKGAETNVLNNTRFAPNKRWHIDTVLRVLKLAGNYVREDILSSFIRLVAQTPDLYLYTVRKLFSALETDISQEGLTLAGAWVIGEYGEMLGLNNVIEGDEESTRKVGPVW